MIGLDERERERQTESSESHKIRGKKEAKRKTLSRGLKLAPALLVICGVF